MTTFNAHFTGLSDPIEIMDTLFERLAEEAAAKGRRLGLQGEGLTLGGLFLDLDLASYVVMRGLFVWFPHFTGVVGCGAEEETDLGFVCFVVSNPPVLSANKFVFGLLLFHTHFSIPPPPQSSSPMAHVHFSSSTCGSLTPNSRPCPTLWAWT